MAHRHRRRADNLTRRLVFVRLLATQVHQDPDENGRSCVAEARPDLDAETARHLAAIVQALGTAATWQTLRDFWGMDGTEAATAATTVLDILLTNPTTPTGGT